MTEAAPVVVRLHREFYSTSAIADAAATFGEFAAFATVEDAEHIAVTISDIDRDVEGDVVAEFCNFALANSAVRRQSEHV